MPEMAREERVASAFVELADTLVGHFDIIHFLYTLVEHSADLLDVAAAGVVLATPHGDILEASATDERTRTLELAGIEWDEGPCRDAFHSGSPVADTPLAGPYARDSWPRFSRRAEELGFTSVAAAPMRLRDQVIGALNLFRDRPTPMAAGQLHLGQALANIATIGILQQRAIHEHAEVAGRLQVALDSRIVIEQAKGALAQRLQIGVDEAFNQLRRYARHHQQRLTEVAREVLQDGLDPTLTTG